MATVRHPTADKTLLVARFEPESIDLMPDRNGVAMLQERALPTDKVEEYLASTYSYKNAWKPNQQEQIHFTVPDPKGGISVPSWHLDPVD
jgi:hypothetical protein